MNSSSSCRKHQSSATVAVAAIRRMFMTHKKHYYYSGNSSLAMNISGGVTKSDEVSARKLAAKLWQLRFMEEVSGDGSQSESLANENIKISHPPHHNFGEEVKKTKGLLRRSATILRSINGVQCDVQLTVANGNVNITFPHYHNFREKVNKRKGLIQRPVTVLRSRNGAQCEQANVDVKVMFPHYHNSGEEVKKAKGLLGRPITILRSRSGLHSLQCELKSSLPCLKCSKEQAKWDPSLAEASNEFTKNHSKKLLEDKKLVGYHDSVVPALLNELLLAQRSINKLKAVQKSSKKKVEQFFQNLEEEKVHWKHREYKKIQAMLDNLKDKLSREKRSRERMESLNTKLVHELAEANFSAKQFMKNYEKEKKERELTEQVCNQLAMQIEESKAKIEELLSYSLKLCEEVEEERKMMQMVNLWREERAQMKLVDAKLVLEDKYNQMVQLIGYLQMFLRSRGSELSTIFESVNIQPIVELSYHFSQFEEIFPISEKLRKNNAGPLSTINIVSLEEEELKKNSLHQSSPSGDYSTALEPTNSSETSCHVEDRKVFSSPQRKGTNLINVYQDNNILGSEAECSEKSDMKSLKTHSKWRPSSASKLLRSFPNIGTTSSSTKASRHRRQGKGSVEGSFRHKELSGQRNSRDSMNPHIARGMKGCIEWPRSTPKANSKVIPLEERVKSQKSQLQKHT